MKAKEVYQFWFEEISTVSWFKKSEEFDALVCRRFGAMLTAAGRGELYYWRETAEGRLAEIIVLDQFSRNIYRDTPQAFSQDAVALVLAQEAICLGLDSRLSPAARAFLYMPFMHSESRIIHKQAVKLFSQRGLESHYQFELRHQEIIECFGRYPHRNEILGRISSAEEIEFLKQPSSRF